MNGSPDTNTDTLKHILKRLDSLDESIRGNGKPGLRMEMNDLRYAVTEHQRWHDRVDALQDQWWRRLIQPGVVLLYAGILSLVVGGIVGRLTKIDTGTIRKAVQEEMQSSGRSDK